MTAVGGCGSLRKDADDFPNYAELIALGEFFGISARVLQIAFDWRGEDELILLNIDEMRQYMEQAGVALFANERIRQYIEERGGDGEYPLAHAILKMATVDPRFKPEDDKRAETGK